jgi:archaetidylinositol phosphate synthase
VNHWNLRCGQRARLSTRQLDPGLNKGINSNKLKGKIMNVSLATIDKEAVFANAPRVNQALTASAEKRALQWMAERVPKWVSSDHLTGLGLCAQIAAGTFYALSRYNHAALLLVILCIVLNWFGDSLDGTLARVRNQQRPRYGFYVDHMVDILGSAALMCGLGYSGFLHWQTAIAMLVAFLLLSSESYLATYTLHRFEMSQGIFGPTEIRILLIIGNLALLRSPYSVLFGHKMLLFDLAGVIAVVGMFAMLIVVTVRHTAELYREEPLP